MESDKFITVREVTSDGQNELVVVDMANPLQPLRQPIAVDSAVMNPKTKIMAMRTGNELQIFDFEKKVTMKTFTVAENVVLWKWVNVETLGIVTETSVYHWKASDGSEPLKVFDRHDSLAGTQVIDYQADEKEQWLCLVGIKALVRNEA